MRAKFSQHVFTAQLNCPSFRENSDHWFGISFADDVFAEINLTNCLFGENYLTASVYFVESVQLCE